MTRETAMQYLQKAAEVVKAGSELRKLEDNDGRQIFCTGFDMYEIHAYDCTAFIEMAEALGAPIEITPEWHFDKGYANFYTTIDGYGEHLWEVYCLYETKKGWPQNKAERNS